MHRVQDVSPFGISISWLGLGGDTPPVDGAENSEPKEENGEKKARDCGQGEKWIEMRGSWNLLGFRDISAGIFGRIVGGFMARSTI